MRLVHRAAGARSARYRRRGRQMRGVRRDGTLPAPRPGPDSPPQSRQTATPAADGNGYPINPGYDTNLACSQVAAPGSQEPLGGTAPPTGPRRCGRRGSSAGRELGHTFNERYAAARGRRRRWMAAKDARVVAEEITDPHCGVGSTGVLGGLNRLVGRACGRGPAATTNVTSKQPARPAIRHPDITGSLGEDSASARARRCAAAGSSNRARTRGCTAWPVRSASRSPPPRPIGSR
jgi:hypothetical protein